jgi:cytochrome c oxidase subunit IV
MAEARAAGGAGHVVPVRIYVVVFGALLLLTAATVGAALVDLGSMSVVVAVGIATAKATLVILYFMGVRYSDRTTAVVVIAGVFWFIHLCAGTLGDYITRGWIGVLGK